MSSISDVIEIDGRKIGALHPPYVIAELSGNHNGDIKRAFRLIEVAKQAGADAVKLQTYTPDTMTIPHDGPDFQIHDGLWKGTRLYDLYASAHTPFEWMQPLFEKGRQIGITVFSTPFDDSAVALLETLDAPAYKIASFENTDLPLIRRVARARKPLIISTGLASLAEIVEATATARAAGAEDLILLHCVSAYPSPAADYNLRTIPHLAQATGTITGLSDHTLGTAVAAAAVALGARVIEKHVTLQRSDGGPDAAFSLEPHELAELVRSARQAYDATGEVNYSLKPSETQNLKFRRSLYVVKDVPHGEPFTAENVRPIRPGFGLAPRHIDAVLGRRAARDIACGTPVSWDLLA